MVVILYSLSITLSLKISLSSLSIFPLSPVPWNPDVPSSAPVPPISPVFYIHWKNVGSAIPLLLFLLLPLYKSFSQPLSISHSLHHCAYVKYKLVFKFTLLYSCLPDKGFGCMLAARYHGSSWGRLLWLWFAHYNVVSRWSTSSIVCSDIVERVEFKVSALLIHQIKRLVSWFR